MNITLKFEFEVCPVNELRDKRKNQLACRWMAAHCPVYLFFTKKPTAYCDHFPSTMSFTCIDIFLS